MSGELPDWLAKIAKKHGNLFDSKKTSEEKGPSLPPPNNLPYGDEFARPGEYYDVGPEVDGEQMVNVGGVMYVEKLDKEGNRIRFTRADFVDD